MVIAVSIFMSAYLFLLLVILIRKYSEANRARQRMELLKSMPTVASVRRARAESGALSFTHRMLSPLFNMLSHAAFSVTPPGIRAFLTRRLVRAGLASRVSTSRFLLLCFSVATFFAIFGVVVFVAPAAPLVQKATIFFLFYLLGLLLVHFSLSRRISLRQEAIRRQLAPMLDLLCVSVEAGLSFDAAIRRITARMQGPLIEELRRMQEDIRMGVVRRTAMRDVAERTDVQEVALFLTSIVQAERLGTSIGHTLKTQAETIRDRRRQYVKAMALKAPVKIVIPLAIFILPALFIVTLLPTVLFLIKRL